MTTDNSTPNGRWSKGISGNPAGRPHGSRNKTTLALEALLEGAAEKLVQKATQMALEGDVMALRLCLERLLPVRRDRLIQLDLPPAKSATEISTALAAILDAVGEGQITPAEGETIARILSAQTDVLTTEELERRLEELERRSGDKPRDDGNPERVHP
jgi:hypothetical protein